MDWVFERVPRREVFAQTGIQFMQMNGLYQLASLIRDKSPLLDYADTLLTISDLFNYWLTGSKTCEFTELTTTQLYNPTTGNWAMDLIEKVGIPTRILPPIVQPGERIGSYNGMDVIVPPCHDTGSAVVAVPTTTENYAYLSSGTWSLLGLEVQDPIINDAAYNVNFTNEGGYANTYRFLKNIMGLWVVNQCRDTWASEGTDYSFEQLAGMVNASDFFKCFIDPDHIEFFTPGDMPARVIDFCKRTNQAIPETHAEIMTAVYVSLAFKYRYVLEQLTSVSGQTVDTLHIIGGGSKNTLLNQMTANATGRQVVAGPTEATAIGNAIVQLISLGELNNVAEARMMLSQSIDTTTYEPQNTAKWDENYERFKALVP
jgi:sugar (pentulose or hexulose) kinase